MKPLQNYAINLKEDNMALHNLNNVIAIFDGENLACTGCADLEHRDSSTSRVYEEKDRDDEKNHGLRSL